MKKIILPSALFAFGLWLLITLLTSKSIKFTDNQAETILGALTAVCVALLFIWIAHYRNKIKSKQGDYEKNVN